MVRQYKPRPKRRDPDKRMARAVELRAEGLSNYKIAERLLCSEITIRRDLKRWDTQNQGAQLRHFPATSVAPGATDVASECRTEDPNVISLTDRRKRA